METKLKNTAWQLKGESVLPAAPMSLPRLIWPLLFTRGFRTTEDIRKCLHPTLHELKNPFQLDNMDQAVQRLLEAYRKKQTIFIYADFDLDGTSGLALLKTGLEALGFEKVFCYQPRRLAEGYGVHVHAIREIVKSGAQVLVTVDVGTTAFDALSEAKNLGLDVIVTDHHLPQDKLPQALALINPNKGTCPSGLGHLAGVGVAFYLILALRRAFINSGVSVSLDPKTLLDFFVIGTLTDMVPLQAENRVLVRHGLWQITHTKRPGLRALMDKLGLCHRSLLTSQDVAIRLAPKLNALSRLETTLRPIDIFLETDEFRAQEMAHQVVKLNEERVRIQKMAEDQARDLLRQQIPKACIWVWSEGFHRGVIGLVATRLAQEWNLPTFVGSVNEEGRIVGSSRLPPLSSLSLVKALTAAAPTLKRFGGHAQAAGFELDLDQASSLADHLNHYFNLLSDQPIPPTLSYDAEGNLEDINPDLMKWHEALGPFGAEFESPVYRLKNMMVKELKEMRGGHLRFSIVSSLSGATRKAVWFSPDCPELVADWVRHQAQVEVLAAPEWNHFQGVRTLQLQLKAMRLA